MADATRTHALQPSTISTAQTVVDQEVPASTASNEKAKDSPIDSVTIYRASPTTATRFSEPDMEKKLGQNQTSSSEKHADRDPQAKQSSTLPPYIPYEQQSSKILVLCFDGTGDQFDSDNSNIVQLVSMLKKDDKQKQMVYYQAGIGTYTSPAVATPFMSKMSKILDEMLAWNLDAHVMGGYEFLMQNYIVGDRICIFGFSRGAYTARSLAGMIHKVGLLPADNHQQVPFAYKMYTRTDSVGWDQSNAFKRAFSVNVSIEFVGVWDTVDSVGFIPKRLPFTTSNTIVKTFRHAVSLDEHRAKFKANLWNRPSKDEQKLDLSITKEKLEELQRLFESDKEQDKHDDHHHHHHHHHHHRSASSSLPASPLSHGSKNSGHNSPTRQDDSSRESNHGDDDIHCKKHSPNRGAKIWTLGNKADQAMNRFESIYSHGSVGETNVEEVWFAGCHCDVGGGSVVNGTRYSLARIPLRWMVRECFKTKTGILFNTDSLLEIGLDPNSVYPHVLRRPEALYDRARLQVIERPPSPPSFLKTVQNVFRSSAAKKRAVQTDTEKRSSQLSAFISEEDEELRDALSPKYDQLKIKRFWWILELLPVSIRIQKDDDQWISYIGINMGRARSIPAQHTDKVKVHRSVKLRLEAQCVKKGDKYQPKADFCAPDWID